MESNSVGMDGDIVMPLIHDICALYWKTVKQTKKSRALFIEIMKYINFLNIYKISVKSIFYIMNNFYGFVGDKIYFLKSLINLKI